MLGTNCNKVLKLTISDKNIYINAPYIWRGGGGGGGRLAELAIVLRVSVRARAHTRSTKHHVCSEYGGGGGGGVMLSFAERWGSACIACQKRKLGVFST